MGAFSHAAAGQVRGITQITYDGDDGDPHTLDAAGLDGVDLTVGGSHSSIVVGLPFADLGAAVTLAVWSDATHCSQRTLPAPASTVPADNRRLQFRYGEFGLGPGCVGPANFTNVGAIRLTIDGTAVGATDLSVEQIQTVPELPPTPTPSGEPTQTPTLTPTPVAVCGNGIAESPEECDDSNTTNGDGCDINCTTTRCGNGIVTDGESCDDGNAVALDGCENDCLASLCLKNTDRLIPGYCNTVDNDCDHEFCTGFPSIPMVRFGGLPGAVVRCTDDDPACDVGPPGDKTCTFQLALCFNVQDQRLPCFGRPPKGVSAVRLRRVKPGKALDIANRTALENALVGIGGVLRVSPGQRYVEFDPPLTAQDRCTASAEFKVPLRVSTSGAFRPGKKMTTVTTEHPKDGHKAAKQDGDYLVMECVPR